MVKMPTLLGEVTVRPGTFHSSYKPPLSDTNGSWTEEGRAGSMSLRWDLERGAHPGTIPASQEARCPLEEGKACRGGVTAVQGLSSWFLQTDS